MTDDVDQERESNAVLLWTAIDVLRNPAEPVNGPDVGAAFVHSVLAGELQLWPGSVDRRRAIFHWRRGHDRVDDQARRLEHHGSRAGGNGRLRYAGCLVRRTRPPL